MTKYIFVTGGVVSGLGKGITVASLGRLLKNRGHKVCLQKFDPYLNVDCGAMSPYQHGEVFVTEDGAETDLDLGHYERFVDENLNRFSNVTTGKIYSSVISKERSGLLGSGTVQVVPHITNEIKDKVYRVGKETNTDIVITEIGGTVGDIESHPFLEAIRQVSSEMGKENVLYIHVTLVPYIRMGGEFKTKPTQHSVKELLSIGIQPDIIVCRSENYIEQDLKDKIALFCNIEKDCVVQNIDCPILYEIPLLLEAEGLARVVCRKLNLPETQPDLTEWTALVNRAKDLADKSTRNVRIALVGKYVELHDAYLSLAEALKHAGIHNGVNVTIDWINSENLTDAKCKQILGKADGIIVGGGYGIRGFAGKLAACKYARENNVPLFGEGMGMHAAILEFARNVAGIDKADSREFNSATEEPVIYFPYDCEFNLYDKSKQRLGAYPCKLSEGSRAKAIYNNEELVFERHHNHYEVNNAYLLALEAAGMRFSGISPNKNLVEIIELPQHKFYIGAAFHPEFKSRPNRAHPIFIEFIKQAMEK